MGWEVAGGSEAPRLSGGSMLGSPGRATHGLVFITEGGGRVLLLLIPQYQEVPGKDNVAAVSSSCESGVEVPWLNNMI